MCEINKPMVTITADEYFDLRSRAEANNYTMQSIESLRIELNNMRNEMMELHNKIYKLENK